MHKWGSISRPETKTQKHTFVTEMEQKPGFQRQVKILEFRLERLSIPPIQPPFHILPKPIIISHPSFFPRCQIFPKVALGACAMTRDRTFSSRSYFGLFLLIFQNPLKARLARNATNPRLSLGVRYLPFTTPTSSWAQLYEFWKASLKAYH